MSWAEEIRGGIAGALALARGDPAGMSLFRLTVDGFWRSFAAALVVAPAYALLVAERGLAPGGAPVDPVAVEAVSYFGGFVAFPAVALIVTRLLGLTARYVPLVVAANWSTVPQAALLLAAVTVGTAIPGLRPFLLLAATLAALVYQWFVIRTSLETAGSVAFGLLVIDVLVSVGIELAADRLLAAPGA